MLIKLSVNGTDYQRQVGAMEKLSHFLRETLGLTGLKEGCGEGECGACTVLIDNQAVNSCLVLAFQAGGKRITTIEGLENHDGSLSALQQAFLDHGAVQCGYCTAGMVMSCEGLLRDKPKCTEVEIRHALAGNLCRCSGFVAIVAALKSTASARLAAAAE